MKQSETSVIKAPVAIFIYKRPDLVKGLIHAISAYQPGKLYIVADGPKAEGGQPESQLCAEARRVAEVGVNWPCEVKRVYAISNMGLRVRLESGLDEVFINETEAILLEEDCHPMPDFFPFCQEMLTRYRENPRIAGIAGNCFLPIEAPISSSYFYSRFLHIWGWATWRRVWNEYDRSKWEWPTEGVRRYFPNSRPDEMRYWNLVYSRVASGQIDTWDYRWTSHLWSRGLLAIVPSQNLIWNRGFGASATNTRDEDMEVGIERELPLPPPYTGSGPIQAGEELDRMVFENHFLRTEGKKNLWGKLMARLRKTPFRLRRQ